MSFTNKEEEKAYKRAWNKANRKRVNEYARENKRRIRNAVFAFLGDRCANPNCRYMNLDGTFGCTDKRLLQVDHINGGGCQEWKDLGGSDAIYRKILKSDGKGYRILCANCNWLHRYEEF